MCNQAHIELSTHPHPHSCCCDRNVLRDTHKSVHSVGEVSVLVGVCIYRWFIDSGAWKVFNAPLCVCVCMYLSSELIYWQPISNRSVSSLLPGKIADAFTVNAFTDNHEPNMLYYNYAAHSLKQKCMFFIPISFKVIRYFSFPHSPDNEWIYCYDLDSSTTMWLKTRLQSNVSMDIFSVFCMHCVVHFHFSFYI